MKNLLFPLMVVLMLSSGCTCVMPSVNQPPTADIDSISPTEVSPGETVTFKGHGTDPDGTVVAYRWRSSVDGDLSTEPNFETSSLSPGEHTVVLKVQDNNGAWSPEDKSRLVVLSGAVEVVVIVQFEANPGGISTGESSTLSWSVSGATTVSIYQAIGSVALTGSRVVSPGVSTTYTLAAANAAGSVTTATAQVIVSAVPPPDLPLINYFTANPPGISAGETSTLSWNVSNATAVTISPGVGAVATAGSISVAPTVTTIYALTATKAASSVTDTTQVSVSAAPPFAVTSPSTILRTSP